MKPLLTVTDEKGNLATIRGEPAICEGISCVDKGICVFAAKIRSGKYRAAIQKKKEG